MVRNCGIILTEHKGTVLLCEDNNTIEPSPCVKKEYSIRQLKRVTGISRGIIHKS